MREPAKYHYIPQLWGHVVPDGWRQTEHRAAVFRYVVRWYDELMGVLRVWECDDEEDADYLVARNQVYTAMARRMPFHEAYFSMVDEPARMAFLETYTPQIWEEATEDFHHGVMHEAGIFP